MRRLAEELHCGTMTLYTHVPARDDLLNGVVGLVIERLDLEYVPAETLAGVRAKDGRLLSRARLRASRGVRAPGVRRQRRRPGRDLLRAPAVAVPAGRAERDGGSDLPQRGGRVLLRLPALRVPFAHPATAGRRGSRRARTRRRISTTCTRARRSTRASTSSSEASRPRSPRRRPGPRRQPSSRSAA